MPHEETAGSPRRRELPRMIGLAAGGAAMYQAMSALGFAQGTRVSNELGLAEAPRGASVLILGAGLAGMTAAYELRRAGYAVQVLEYNDRPVLGASPTTTAICSGTASASACRSSRSFRSTTTATCTVSGLSAAGRSAIGASRPTIAAWSRSCSPRRSTSRRSMRR